MLKIDEIIIEAFMHVLFTVFITILILFMAALRKSPGRFKLVGILPTLEVLHKPFKDIGVPWGPKQTKPDF